MKGPDERDARLAFAIFEGRPSSEIACEFDVSDRFVRYVARGEKLPHVAAQIESMYRDLVQRERNRIIRARYEALNVLCNLLEAPNPTVRLRAATRLLAEPVEEFEDERPLTPTEVIAIVRDVQEAEQVNRGPTKEGPANRIRSPIRVEYSGRA